MFAFPCFENVHYLMMLIVLKDSTVKPVLSGHAQDKEKWPHKTGDLLKEVQFKKKMTF